MITRFKIYENYNSEEIKNSFEYTFPFQYTQMYDDHGIKNNLDLKTNDEIKKYLQLYTAYKRSIELKNVEIQYFFKTDKNQIATRYNVTYPKTPFGSHTGNSVHVIENEQEFDEFMLNPELFIEKEKYNL